jgi:4'-phosphopantetheinyl transferase
MLPTESGIDVVVMRGLSEDDDSRAAFTVLSSDERRRADRFVKPSDRQRFIARRAQLRKLLGERLGVPPNSVVLSFAPHGKPLLAAPLDRSGITFSISHSGDVSVYAFASRADIGIDVEAIRTVEDADRIAAIAFSRLEYETYERLPVADKAIAFLNCWTRKEALVKATGHGLSSPLAAFDVSLAPGEPAQLLRLGSCHGDSGWRLYSFLPAAGFVAAVAARSSS